MRAVKLITFDDCCSASSVGFRLAAVFPDGLLGDMFFHILPRLFCDRVGNVVVDVDEEKNRGSALAKNNRGIPVMSRRVPNRVISLGIARDEAAAGHEPFLQVNYDFLIIASCSFSRMFWRNCSSFSEAISSSVMQRTFWRDFNPRMTSTLDFGTRRIYLMLRTYT